MGGDHIPCSTSEDEFSMLDNDFHEYLSQDSSFYRDDSRNGDYDESIIDSYEFVHKGYDEVCYGISSNSMEIDGNLRRRKIAYHEIMKNYDELWVRSQSLYQGKSRILSYQPGSWISNRGGKNINNYMIPKTTTLLLIGPKGSGKSSLVNRISRVFEDDKFGSERAQVTYNPSTGEGTYFLQEYMIPRGSTSFCLFDTRSLSENFAENDELLQRWMTKGVRHGELIIRDSDPSSLKDFLKCKAQQSGTPCGVIRKVNFVIFVVNGFQVLRSMNSDKKEDIMYMEMVAKTFNYPYLSFKDDKPVLVVTHGDLLSLGDRARVRVYLGEKLGIPPAKQIFDIRDNSDSTSEVMMVDMIRYSLEHADKNIPCKESTNWVEKSTFIVNGVKDKVSGLSFLVLLFTILLGIACAIMPTNQITKQTDPLVPSTIEWRPHEAQYSYNAHDHEPLITYGSNSESTSTVNHSQKNKGHENANLESTPTPTIHHPESVMVVTSEPTVTIKTLASESEQAFETTVITTEPIFPSKSEVFIHDPTLSSKSKVSNSEPILPLESVEDYHDKRRDSRSPSPKHRHPKQAVKWHKIRHLWLDE